MATEKRLGIFEHLEELRSRLIIAIIAIFVTTSLAYVFSDTLIFILRSPAGDIKLQAFSPMDGFLIKFRVALYGGIFLAAPVWLFQVLRFLAPGLLPHERKFLIPGVIAHTTAVDATTSKCPASGSSTKRAESPDLLAASA